jgi:hypothetical protein
MNKPLVAVLMGSKSDWDTMQHVASVLKDFGVPHECMVLSAHRTPKEAATFAERAESRGLEVIIAGAGGAAHLAGVLASLTTLPVLGVPMESASLKGMDSLLVHRSDARRHSRGHLRHRQTRRHQRRPPGRGHFGQQKQNFEKETPRVPNQSSQKNSREHTPPAVTQGPFPKNPEIVQRGGPNATPLPIPSPA